jgi:hypothetical protein
MSYSWIGPPTPFNGTSTDFGGDSSKFTVPCVQLYIYFVNANTFSAEQFARAQSLCISALDAISTHSSEMLQSGGSKVLIHHFRHRKSESMVSVR